MANPTKKAGPIEQLLTKFTGTDRRKSITGNVCTWCKEPAENFRDFLSEKEYTISGFCQSCQDKTFGR